MKVQADKKGRTWTVDFHTRLERTRVDKVDLAEFQKFQEDVMNAFRVDVMSKPANDN